MTFVIPTDFLPMSSTGQFNLAPHAEFLKQLRFSEENKEQSSLTLTSTTKVPKKMRKGRIVDPGVAGVVIDHPGEFDILLVRGSSKREYPGNLRFHHLIGQRARQYEATSKSEKVILTHMILLDIKEMGSRFLKKNGNNGWWVVPDSEARQRISHAFRNRRLLSGNANKASAVAVDRNSSGTSIMSSPFQEKNSCIWVPKSSK